jgi:hypothetical protein
MRVKWDGEDIDDRWALNASDRTLLGNKTGATRLGFAVLLKMFQVNGRFPYRVEEVPVAAVEAIANQIEVPAEAFFSPSARTRELSPKCPENRFLTIKRLIVNNHLKTLDTRGKFVQLLCILYITDRCGRKLDRNDWLTLLFCNYGVLA